MKERSRVRLAYFVQASGFSGGEQILTTLLDELPGDEYQIACICTDIATLSEVRRRLSHSRASFVLFESPRKPSIWRTVRPLSTLLASIRPHIVHCHSIDGYAGAYAILASRLIGVPVVLGTIHTAGGHARRRLPDRLFGRLVDSLTHSAILVAEYCRHPVLRDRYLASDKLTVIHNGVPLPPLSALQAGASWRKQANNRSIIVGTAGAMIPRKGFDTFVSAGALLRGRGQMRFVILGDGPEKANLLAQTFALGLSDIVSFPGWQESVLPELLGMDIFVLPSLNEAGPVVVLEAMACGIPVVASRVGGIPEYVVDGQTGLLVPPRDPRALADAIWALVANPDVRFRMGQAGRARVGAHFNSQQMVERTRCLYRELLRQRSPVRSLPDGVGRDPT